MEIRLQDIGQDGLKVDFDLELGQLNERVNVPASIGDADSLKTPSYTFTSEPKVSLFVELRGETILVKGSVSGTFCSACSRCAEDIDTSISNSIDLVLRPATQCVTEDGVEDISYGYYQGESIDCSDLAEEALIRVLPFVVTCSAPSVEECDIASKDPELVSTYQDEPEGDERFAVLRNLKIT